MAFGIGEAAAIAAPIAGGVLGLVNQKSQDKRQIKQTKELTKIAQEANKEQAKYTSDLQYDMWNKTNAEAQVEHYEKAGLNPALMYGMGGGGGVTTGSASAGSVGTAQAANSAQTGANELGMGMMLTQMANIQAQTEKTKAETENLEAGTEKTGVDTETGKLNLDTATKTQQETIEKIIGESGKAQSEAAIAFRQNQLDEKTVQYKIKQIQEDTIAKILGNEQTKVETRKKQAEAAIEQFEAENTKNGISTKAPWYIKLMSNLYDKIEEKIK